VGGNGESVDGKYYHNLELVLRRSIRDRLAGTPSDASTIGTGFADCW
jgi:hypothetical protein